MVGGSPITIVLLIVSALSLSACAAHIKPYGPGPNDPRAERIVIEKSAQRMVLYKDGAPWKEYQIALGRGGLAPKMREGDMLTPEGIYYIKNRNPQSVYHRALRISYPSPDDVKRAIAAGVKPGHNIMIHGLSSDQRRYGRNHIRQNWTEGCVAVTDYEIDQIWNSVADGTPVEIRS